MNVLEFLLLLVVAGVSGSIGQAIAGYTRGGCLASIALGFIGALVGVWLARALELLGAFSQGGDQFTGDEFDVGVHVVIRTSGGKDDKFRTDVEVFLQPGSTLIRGTAQRVLANDVQFSRGRGHCLLLGDLLDEACIKKAVQPRRSGQNLVATCLSPH